MRKKIPIPDDFHFHLDKGEESLSQLANPVRCIQDYDPPVAGCVEKRRLGCNYKKLGCAIEHESVGEPFPSSRMSGSHRECPREGKGSRCFSYIPVEYTHRAFECAAEKMRPKGVVMMKGSVDPDSGHASVC